MFWVNPNDPAAAVAPPHDLTAADRPLQAWVCFWQSTDPRRLADTLAALTRDKRWDGVVLHEAVTLEFPENVPAMNIPTSQHGWNILLALR